MGLIFNLFKNTGYLTIGNQIGNLLQFLFFLYFAREFGDRIVGQYSFAFSLTYLFSIVADLGLSPYLMREIARDKSGNREIFFRCLILRLFSIALLSLLAALIILMFFNDLPKEIIKMIILLGLFHVFFSIADVFLAEFKAHDRMGLVAILSIFVRFVVAAFGIFLIMLGFDFLKVLISFPLGSFMYLMLCIYFSLHYFGKLKQQLWRLDLTNLLINLLPFTFAIVLVESLHHQDILILRLFQQDQAVGVYSAANKIVLALLGIILFVHTALLPTFSRLYVDSQPRLIALSKSCLRYLLLLALPIATMLHALSDKLILFLYSDTFLNSIIPLSILSWTVVFGFAAAIYSVLLTAINRQTEKVIAIAICLAFNFALNFLLIPTLSFNGAAAAKLLTEVLHLSLMAYLVSRYLIFIPVHRVFVKPAVSCVLMYLFIQLSYQWNLVYIVVISTLVYLFSLIAMRGYTEQELEIIKHICVKKILRRESFKTYGTEN